MSSYFVIKFCSFTGISENLAKQTISSSNFPTVQSAGLLRSCSVLSPSCSDTYFSALPEPAFPSPAEDRRHIPASSRRGFWFPPDEYQGFPSQIPLCPLIVRLQADAFLKFSRSQAHRQLLGRLKPVFADFSHIQTVAQEFQTSYRFRQFRNQIDLLSAQFHSLCRKAAAAGFQKFFNQFPVLAGQCIFRNTP